jgi:hypothetical protein
MLRRHFMQGAAASALLLSKPARAWVHGAASAIPSTIQSQNLAIGGIGLTRGLTMAADGTMLTWNDSVGPYKGNTATIPGSNAAPFTPWTQAIRGGTTGGSGGTNFPSSWLQAPTPYLGQGCVEIATVANNSNFQMAMICGVAGHAVTNLFKTTDGGTTWTLTNFPTNSLSSNSGTAPNPGTWSQSIVIDPNNNNIAWVTGDSNVEVTLDGGATWNTCAGLPTARCFAMAYDPTTPNRLVVGSFGNGLYVSTNANLGTSATFTLVSAAVLEPGEGRFGSDGTYYCTDGATLAGIWRLTSANVFSQITTASGCYTVAVDPNNPARVATWSSGNSSLGGQGALIMNSTAANTGAPTFVGPGNKSMGSTPDAPHVGNSFNNINGTGANGNTTMTNGNGLWFDPWTTTSTSTVTIVGTGNVTFNVPDGIPNITVGRQLRATNTGTPTNYMIGNVASYTSLGGGRANLTLTLIAAAQGFYLGGPSGGTGTFSAWTISAERVYMNSGPGGGPTFIDGFTSGTQAVGSCTFGLEGSSVYDIIWPVGGNPVLVTQDRGIFPVARNPYGATGGVVDCYGFGNYTSLFEATTLSVIPGASPAASFITGGFSGFLKNATNINVVSDWSATAQPPANTGPVAAANSNIFMACGGPGAVSQAMDYTLEGAIAWTPSSVNVSSGSYNDTTGAISLTLAASITHGAPPNIFYLSSLTATGADYTISSGSYDNTTGVFTLNFSASTTFSNGVPVTIALTGSGTNIGRLDGVFNSVSGSGTSTVTFQGAAGLNNGSGTVAISITGGTATVLPNLDTFFTSTLVSGTNVQATGLAGLGTISITGGVLKGTTWNQMPSPAPTSGWSWQAPFITSHSLDFDTTSTGPFIFYAANFSDGFVYQFSVPASGTPTVTQKGQFFNTTSEIPGPGLALKCVPGHAGHLFASAGDCDTSTSLSQVFSSHPNGASVAGNYTRLQFSSNQGGIFTPLSSTQEVITFGLGAPTTGGSGYPTIFAIGWCGGGQYGLYQCINFNPASLGSETWTLITNYIGTYGIGLPVCVAGDPNQEGRCIVGTNGNGATLFQVSGQANAWF